MKKTNVWCIIVSITALFVLTGILRADADTDSKSIKETIAYQVAEWNKGNVDGFMSGYWQSEEFTFQSGNKRLLGYATLAAMYKKNYAGAKMGTLTFTDIVLKPLADGLYLVLGRWNVKTTDSEKEGLFTLIFKNIDGHWKIIHDHSS